MKRQTKIRCFMAIMGLMGMYVGGCDKIQPTDIVLDIEDNGTTINIEIGQSFEVRLASNATTGFEWSIAELDTQIVENTGFEYVLDQPVMTGSGGMDSWIFTGRSVGTTQLQLVYSRSWESVPPAQTFEITINVTAANTNGNNNGNGNSNESMCGGIAGVQCPEGQFCYFEPGICGEGDQSGICIDIPTTCDETHDDCDCGCEGISCICPHCPPIPVEYRSVCGCDGNTYANDCLAAQAGVSVASEGDCGSESIDVLSFQYKNYDSDVTVYDCPPPLIDTLWQATVVRDSTNTYTFTGNMWVASSDSSVNCLGLLDGTEICKVNVELTLTAEEAAELETLLAAVPEGICEPIEGGPSCVAPSPCMRHQVFEFDGRTEAIGSCCGTLPEGYEASLIAIEDFLNTIATRAPIGGGIEELVTGNSEFAFDLYQQLRTTDGNIFYSPYSISSALAMTYAGARGDTETEMAGTLHFTLSQTDLHPAFKSLNGQLASRATEPLPEGTTGDPFKLNIANSLWGQTGFDFLQTFLDVLNQNYGAGLQQLDFSADPESARQTINGWVSDHTEEKIPELLHSGDVTADTRLVLTNAVYFNASWASPFNADNTQDDTFNLLDEYGQPTIPITVPMMSQTGYFKYVAYAIPTDGEEAGPLYEAIELPYIGNQLSMVIFLPLGVALENLEGAFNSEHIPAGLNSLSEQYIHLTMPKFSYRQRTLLAPTLSAMGMPSAFLGTADFSGMTDPSELFISSVIHEAFVSVDETGTEAAAATAVGMAGTSGPGEEPTPIEFKVDQPFIFIIRDIPTGTILFIGRVVDPSQS